MGLSEELAGQLSDPGEPDINLEEGTINGKHYESPAEVKDAEAELGEDLAEPEAQGDPTGEDPLSAQDDAEDPDDGPQQKTVPLDALHAERRERQKLEGVIHTMEARFSKLMEAINSRQVPEAEAKAEPSLEERIKALGERPDEFEDPSGFDDWGRKELALREEYSEKRLKDLEEKLQEKENSEKFESTFNTLRESVVNAENSVRQQHPEYQDALTYVRTKYIESQREAGRVGTDEQFLQEALQHETKISLQMAMQGMNPAMQILQLASNLGFKPQQQGGESDGSQDSESMQKLETVEQGQNRNRRGSASGGKAATPDSLQNMGDDDFDFVLNQIKSNLDFDTPIT